MIFLAITPSVYVSQCRRFMLAAQPDRQWVLDELDIGTGRLLLRNRYLTMWTAMARAQERGNLHQPQAFGIIPPRSATFPTTE